MSSVSQSGSESGSIWYRADLFKEPEPETNTVDCTFRPTDGLMAPIISGQASVHTLIGQEVWELPLNPTDWKKALRLSSNLTGFARIFYHASGEPRDEATIFLTHPEINQPDAKRKYHRDAATCAERQQLDQLTSIIQIFRANAHTEASRVGQFVSPPTSLGYVTIDRKRAKIITGLVWLGLGEDEDEEMGRQRN